MIFASPLAVHRSRKLIAPFRLHRPTHASQAAEMKKTLGPSAVFMAGGIDVANRMKFGAPVTDVIHLGGVPGLDSIGADGTELRLGSLVTHDRLATSSAVRASQPRLAETWCGIANIRVRCKGTIGGNMMAGDPAYDFALAAAAAGARLEFAEADGSTKIIAAGALANAGDVGLLIGIVFPRMASCRLIFDRSLRPVVTLAIGLDFNDEAVVGGRLAIGCAYRQMLVVDIPIAEPLPLPALDAAAQDLATATAVSLPEPLTDHHASAAYRRRMIAVLLRRKLGGLE
jgi:aerobic carbon-monoxide dehydrogenase medium subunit